MISAPNLYSSVTAALADHSAYDSWRPTRTYTDTPSIRGQSATGTGCLYQSPTARPFWDSGKPQPACLPHSIFTRSTKLYIVLTGDVGEFYLFLSCVAVFTQGKLQSPKKIYTLTMEDEEEGTYKLMLTKA